MVFASRCPIHSCSVLRGTPAAAQWVPGVAQVVEPDLADASPPQSGAEAPAHLRGIERASRHRMAKNEVLPFAEQGAAVVCKQLAPNPSRHRHAARRPQRLWRPEAVPRVAAPNAEAAGAEVHIKPAQREQLALSQASHRCGKKESAVPSSLLVSGHGIEERVELAEAQEADVRVASRGWRSIDGRDRVRGGPAPLNGVSEDAVEENQMVGDRLARQALALLREEVGLHVVWLNPTRPPFTENGPMCRRNIER